MEKNLKQIKTQTHRIEMMMLNKNFNPKNPKRHKRWCKICDIIDRRLLDFFKVEHLWYDGVDCEKPIPYEVRITI